MRTFLSFVLVAIIPFVATVSLCADFVWKPCERVDLSLDNERLAAIDRASSWLLQKQESDGSFGKCSRTTSLSLLALFILNDFSLSEDGLRAKEWLLKQDVKSPWCEIAIKAISGDECKVNIEPQSEMEKLLINTRKGHYNSDELIKKLVTSQTICNDGTGCWGNDTSDTAIAILLLMEIK